MNDDQASPQTMASVPGMPLPAGTDDNGNPYWMIEGRKVLWAEMQQYLWQVQQRQQSAASTSGKGLEGGLNQVVMPNMEAQLAVPPSPELIANPENRLESGRERGGERRESESRNVEVQQQQRAPQPQQPAANTTPAAKAPSLLGDSPALSQVDPSSPASIITYVETHHKDPADSSSRFLSELLGKIVKVFSLEH